MSPNMSYETLQPFSPRPTVAKRKQALELRKAIKPLMEKRRRARINDSLDQLKNLILPLTGRDKTRFSKLEKADILEMTVRFLSNMPAANTKESAVSYRDGYRACLQRVSSLLPKSTLDPESCRRVNDFVQQSMSSGAAPTCVKCCGQERSRTFPEIQGKLISLNSNVGSRPENQLHQRSSGAVAPGGAQPGPQPISAAMWRPW